jgi:hypothetical protein
MLIEGIHVGQKFLKVYPRAVICLALYLIVIGD